MDARSEPATSRVWRPGWLPLPSHSVRGASSGAFFIIAAMPRARAADRPALLPPLLPAPVRSVRHPGVFVLQADAPIVLPPSGDGCDDATATRLRDAVAAACAIELAIAGHRRAEDLGPRIELAIDPTVSVETQPALREQAYRIDVDPARARVIGAGAAGLRYGVETLIQLIDARGRIPCCRIDDAPGLALRGLMLDVSRGKVPTEQSLGELIDLCAVLRLNVLMLYTEHTFRFRRHPEIGLEAGSLDAATMRRLDARARARFVDLVPCLQSLGHMEHILKLPAYRQLAETDMGWTIAPAAEGTCGLLADLYDEYLPNFSSRLFNANCDEPWDLGRGRSAALSEELGPGGLYLSHVRRIRDLAARNGKRTLIWGDVVHAHPERIAEIDRDLVLLDWWYEAEFDFDRVAVFARNGIDFMVCPGTSTWNSLFPRIDNSLANISGWADAGRRHGALGLLNTDWGDFGHYNLQGGSLFAYAWGAQEAWSGPAEAAHFDRAFSRVLFGDPGGAVARLYRALGAIHDPGFTMFNGSALQFLFFDDVERGYFVDATRPAKCRATLARLEALRPKIATRLERSAIGRRSLRELLYACEASSFAVRKADAARELLAWRRGELALGAAARRKLSTRLAALADEQTDLGRRLRELWLARARPSNLAFTLGRVRSSARSLRRGAKRLLQNRPGRAPARSEFSHKGAIEAMRATF